MKQLSIISLLLSISFFVNAQENYFKGKITGIDSATIKVVCLPLILGEKPQFKIIKCNNDSFDGHISFTLNKWHLIRLNSNEFNTIFKKQNTDTYKLKNREIIFFTQPGDQITISARIEKYGIYYEVYGNKISIQRNEVEKELFPLEEEFNRLTILKSKFETEKQTDKIKRINYKIDSINKRIEQVKLEIIVKHPEWEYSAEILPRFPADTIAKYYSHFTPEVKNSFFGKHIAKFLYAARVGSQAPDFSLQDEKGKNIALASYKGQYIILDFWGTWCGYCLRGIPKMKEYYQKYRNKAVYITICCLDNENSWRNTLQKYQTEWINLFAENQEIPDKYGVTGYPTKIIIGKDGTIIFKATGETQAFYNKIDQLFGN